MVAWQKDLLRLCERFDIPIEYLAATLNDPKVVPMIRGKAFEFSAVKALKKILPEKQWKVEKPTLNAQAEIKDIDVKVTHLPTSKIIRVECKLAGNKGFRHHPTRKLRGSDEVVAASSTIRVKCMRSRTLGTSKVEELAPKIGISETALAAHADSYRMADFDVVLTSIGNAFYRTNDLGEYQWQPSEAELEFLERLHPDHPDPKIGAFEQLYLASAADLAVGNPNFPLQCGRKKCQAKSNCGFIPNYPSIRFPDGATEPDNEWVSIQKGLAFFQSLVTEPQPLEAKTIVAEQLAEQVNSNSQ